MNRIKRILSLIAALALSLALSSGVFASGTGDGKGVVSEGNSVKLLPSGRAFFDELLSAVDAAEHYICVEYFTIGTDSIGTLLLGRLAAKAAEGLSVYVMIDRYGSFCADACPMDGTAMEAWHEKGLDIALFNDDMVGSPLPRDHRKLTIVDGVIAFIGGMNIRDQYIVGSPKLGEVNDMSLRIDGPAAARFVPIFEEAWNTYSNRPKIRIDGGSVAELHTPGVSLEILPTSGGFPPSEVRLNYVRLIDGAKKSIKLVNGYFMPSPQIIKALKRAAGRGVKVEILLGETTDLPFFLYNRPFRIAKRLARRENVTLHIYKGGFFHEKAISIDSERVLIGSANLDYLSRRINHEICVLISDKEVAAQYEAIYDNYTAR